MLLNAYRAIFKSAYFKGMASTVILTAGLAAGAANAAHTLSDDAQLTDAMTNVYIDGSGAACANYFDKIQVSGGVTLTPNQDQTIIITSGAASSSANYVSGSKTAAISGDGSLIINISNSENYASHGLLVGNSGAVTLGSIDVQKGLLKISGSNAAAAALAAADTITVGTLSTFDEKNSGATVEVGTHGTLGSYENGKGSTIDLKGDGVIKLASGATVEALALNAHGGVLKLDAAGKKVVNLNVHSGTWETGLFDVASGSTVNFKLQDNDTNAQTKFSEYTFKSGTINVAGELALQTVTGSGAAVVDMSSTDLKIVSVSGASTGTLTGTGAITQGNKISVSGASTNDSMTLRISEDNLVQLLTDDDAQGNDDNKAGLDIKDYGVLELSDDKVVLSNSEIYKFSGSSNGGPGLITIAKNATLQAKTVVLESAINDANNNSFSGTLSVNDLQITGASGGLGSTKDFLGSNAVLKISNSLSVNDVASFDLDNKAVFDTGETYAGELNGKTGDISKVEKLVVSNETTFKGKWNISTDIEVSGSKTANVYIGSGSYADVKMDGEFILGKSGAVTISGQAAGTNGEDMSAVLDLSDGKLSLGTLSTKGDNPKLQVLDHGTLIVQSDDLQAILNAGNNSGAEIMVSGSSNYDANGVWQGGTIKAIGDLELAFNGVSGASHVNGINVSGNGMLIVEGELTLENAESSKGGEIKFDGIVDVESLTLNDLNSRSGGLAGTPANNGSVKFSKGTFVSHGDVSSVNDTLLLAGSDAQGAATLILDTEGSAIVEPAIELSGSSNASGAVLEVQNGAWTLSDVTIASGTFTVGNVDWADSNDETHAIEASVDLDSLTLSGAGSLVTINKTANLIVDEFTALSNSTVTVVGQMTINGKYTEGGYELSYGVDYDDGVLTVANGGQLTFGSDALNDLYTEDGKINSGHFGKITMEQGSELNLAYTDNSAGTLTLDDALALKEGLIAGASGDNKTINGIINVGKRQLEGVEVENGRIAWSEVEAWADFNSDITNADLAVANVYDIESTSGVKGSYGSLSGKDSVTTIKITGNTALNNALETESGKFFASSVQSGKLQAADLDVAAGLFLNLNNGGTVGKIELAYSDNVYLDTVLNVNNTADSVTNIEAITSSGAQCDNAPDTVANINGGTTNVAEGVEVNELLVNGLLNVGGKIDVDTLDLESGVITSTGEGAHQGTIETEELYTSEGTGIVTGEITFGSIAITKATSYADAVYGDDVNHSFVEGTISTQKFTVNDNLVVAGNVQVSDVMEVAKNAKVIVGVDSLAQDNPETTDVDESSFSNTGYLYVKTLKLSGATLIVDTEWTEDTAYAVLSQFNDVANTAEDIYSGTVNGTTYVGKNAVLGIGFENDKAAVEALINEATNGQGLTEGGVENALVLGKAITVCDTDAFYLSSKNYDDFMEGYKLNESQYHTNTMESNSALVIDMDVFAKVAESDDHNSVVYFDQEAASIYAPVTGTGENATNAKVIVTGDYAPGTKLNIFNDKGNDGVDVYGTITVQSANGFWQKDLSGDGQGMGEVLTPSDDSREILSGASDPVYDHLMKYAYDNLNWADETLENEAVGSGLYVNEDDKDFDASKVYSDPVDDNGNYELLPSNAFLNHVLSTGNGRDAETVARMAVYGGAAEVAMAASSTTYEAISARMGMGNPNGNLIMADNANGSGIWLAPVYKNHESDDFDAQGVDYGVDLDLYGVALGADYTFAPGFRVGAMFNVGSGDADGQGAGSAVSNDFDYWSAAIYAGFAYENFSIAGDVTYTAVDNDMDASTSQGKYSASMDADVFTVGLTAQYKFEFAALDVTPHIGMRYSYIDIDDYSVGDIAQSDVDDISVFSIPVGVSLSKDFATASGWVVKPALDLTITANTGDDEVDSDVRFNGVDLTTDLSTEFIDDVTYGATLGLQVQKDSFQFGLGVNYTGSENTDEYGVAANARFTF